MANKHAAELAELRAALSAVALRAQKVAPPPPDTSPDIPPPDADAPAVAPSEMQAAFASAPPPGTGAPGTGAPGAGVPLPQMDPLVGAMFDAAVDAVDSAERIVRARPLVAIGSVLLLSMIIGTMWRPKA